MMTHLDDNEDRNYETPGLASETHPEPRREAEPAAEERHMINPWANRAEEAAAPQQHATPAPEPPPAFRPEARDDAHVRSHTDLRKHIQAQLELIRSKRVAAPREDEARPDAAPLRPAYPGPGESPVPEFSTPPPPDSMPGAMVIEMRPPSPFRSEPEPAPAPLSVPAPAMREPQPAPRPEPEAEEPAPAAAQEAVLERVNGNLAQLAAPGGILRRIIQEKLTGQLLLISEGESENLQELAYIQEGVLVGCSSLLQTPIRNHLLSAGLIRIEDIEEAQRQTGQGQSVESWLIRQGLVTREQVFETLGVAAREAVVGMMCREFGIFAWKGLRQHGAPKALCKIPVREVALHYGRNLESYGAINPEIFAPQRIFKIHDSFNLTHSQFRLLPHEWKFLFRVDGKRTVRQIREAIDIPSESLNRCVFVCDLMGFITDCGLAPEVPGMATLTPPPATPAAFPERKAPPQAHAIDDRPKILIVDDSRTVQKMVLMALERQNYNMRTADDGIEALQLIEGEAPDLVLLDVIMPKMDGYKVCSKIRKLLAPAKIPIIMLTAKDGTYNNIRAKLAGATTVVNKPFDPEELRQTIGKHLPVRQ